jgi:hypothetical protein
MTDKGTRTPVLDIQKIVQTVLGTIEREREREIISRRFGLFDRKETLEQIGELLGITRERVRQLEKAVLAKLKANAEKGLPGIKEIDEVFSEVIGKLGNIARVSDVAAALTSENSKLDQARVAFLAELSPHLVVIEDNDHFNHAIGLAKVHDEKAIRTHIQKLIDTIREQGKPVTAEQLAALTGFQQPAHVTALAGVSKQLASLGGLWGLAKWPLVNPKNIRDKIYVILREHGKHMHFNEIAQSIKNSAFKRKDVTTQAIHNELIKDKRFVLVGRGMYALKEWGYKKGTVADMIAEVLRKENGPLHRDEIVKRVLKHRFVKETTILLNLQGKQQFKRVAKATYALAE